MGEGRFRIITDPKRLLLHIALTGHWEVADVLTYKTALGEAVQRMRTQGCTPGSIAALVDTREGGVQSQDVVAAWQRELGSMTPAPRRLATIVSSALLRRQVDRIAIANQRLFDNEDEAMAWLLSSEDIS